MYRYKPCILESGENIFYVPEYIILQIPYFILEYSGNFH